MLYRTLSPAAYRILRLVYSLPGIDKVLARSTQA